MDCTSQSPRSRTRRRLGLRRRWQGFLVRRSRDRSEHEQRTMALRSNCEFMDGARLYACRRTTLYTILFDPWERRCAHWTERRGSLRRLLVLQPDKQPMGPSSGLSWRWWLEWSVLRDQWSRVRRPWTNERLWLHRLLG